VIYGIGTDMIEIVRIEDAMRRNGKRFAERILGQQELTRYEQRSKRYAARGLTFLATRFAAKEAVSKALGLGMRAPMTWRAVEILNEPSGRPVAVVHGALQAFVAQRRIHLHVSVSDERAYAIAYAIAEILDEEA
jgi:holo-[acyl-carrier protein] synthase